MLTLLHIENIAVIERSEISFKPGLNILTGETGAGKSIVIDALGAVLGQRTSRDLVRTGSSSAVVSAIFTLGEGKAARWLAENGIELEDGSLVIQREIGADGRGVCRLCGRIVTVAQLRALGMMLINLHGQHDSQQLLHEEYHLEYLDQFARDIGEVEAYRSAYEGWRELEQRRDKLKMDTAERARRMDILRYQIEEISAVSPTPEEEEELTRRRSLLQNAGKVTEAVTLAGELISGGEEGEGARSMLAGAVGALAPVAKISPELSEAYESLCQISYMLDDASYNVARLGDNMDFSPGELESVEERFDQIYRLKKKYGQTVSAILDFAQRCQDELDELENIDTNLQKIDGQCAAALEKARQAAAKLTKVRKKAAKELEGQILQQLLKLDMGKTQFQVALTPINAEDEAALSANGSFFVRFLISTNVGEPLKPLSRVASGGELARVMLAIKNVLADTDELDTMVFDEVDSGVSGRAAQKVAQALSQLSRRRQVLCVTHLPQMAAMADTHFLIEKQEQKGRTITQVTQLDDEGRRMEIARLTSGEKITETTLSNAGELLESALAFRRSR